ncbi:MAG: hypothetical protein COU27_00740 [Candidatus Levybacteria bacterium CG10_big_fil_rev_8_21_14_0_10_36_7]|nr:MAG: hypothetical protein COU27_00740 [Candidatus Levybacteria bacterium CG10_big_fil_rev_8_21_14_0_10_36_7]
MLSKRFPGRESYPGDIFFAHAGLLERAGNFHHPEKKQVSITSLPIANIVEGDITGYISTNLMGMTDGHILFDADIYNKGFRPAINIPISVTRVGRQTQNKLLRKITVEILSILSKFEKVQNISHLGTELSDDSKKILQKGKAVETILHQEQMIIPREIQLILFGVIWLSLADFSIRKNFETFLAKILELYKNPEFQKQANELILSDSIAQLLTKIKNNSSITALCN